MRNHTSSRSLSLCLCISLVSALPASLAPTSALAQSKVAAEIYVGGVFDLGRHATAEQIARSAEPLPPVRPAAFFREPEVDATGAASQIVLQVETTPGRGEIATLLASSGGCTTSVACATALLDAVNRQSNALVRASLGQPLGARFLIEDYRMSERERADAPADGPALALQRYLVLRYSTVDTARTALAGLSRHPDIANAALDQTMTQSTGWTWTGADDPYMTPQSDPATYQWGMHRMNFPAAWTLTPGNAYLGASDGGVPLRYEGDLNGQNTNYFGYCWNGYYYVYSFNCDLADNLRIQFSLAPGGQATTVIHGTHVVGIMAARGGNSQGVSGGCPWCSVTMGRMNGSPGPLSSNAAAVVTGLADRGMQAINISANAWGINSIVGWKDSIRCGDSAASSYAALCSALYYASLRDVNVVASAGNYRQTHRVDNRYVPVPTFPATENTVLSVGGIQPDNGMWDQTTGLEDASSAFGGTTGVVAPAKNVVSTMPWVGAAYNYQPWVMCGDASGYDASGIFGDKFGTCTGTSMAAPHVTALVGLIRSANPLLSYTQVNDIVRNSGDLAPYWMNSERGYGVPNAYNAVAAAINTNSSRLTPLFAFYSQARADYFYTIVPQMGGAALRGTLRPANESYVGYSSNYGVVGDYVPGMSNFPGMYYWEGIPAAQAWVFSTAANPLNPGLPLSPLYRVSWKCGDGQIQTQICYSLPAHTDTAYTADPAGIAAFASVGYNLDGIEGYIYPKAMQQPYGTVRLLRKYNPNMDDHAIFPEVQSIVDEMINRGYTQNSGSDWLGWVYPNYGYQPTVQ